MDSEDSLVDKGDERDITDAPTNEMVAASEKDMVMEE